MKKYVQSIVTAFAGLALLATSAQSQTVSTIPHLEKQGTATQLVVDGKPFLALAAELHNSSASSLEYMKPLWPKLVAAHLNTVLATVSWELIEPQEGKFDFSLVDGLLQEARANDLHLVLLWFGSWKNGKSSYQPLWVKTNQDRFPLACDSDGKSMPIMTTFSDANRDADAHAFAALMRHLREVDGEKHTVLMIQVENEVGTLGDSRDRSPACQRGLCPADTQGFDGLSGAAQKHAGAGITQSVEGQRQQNLRHLGESVWSGQAGFGPAIRT